MLSQNLLVSARRSVERLYIGSFTVTEHQKVVKTNHSTGFSDVVVLKNQPCRLSFVSAPPSTEGGAVASLTQNVKLFFSPAVSILPGSKITVTQNGVTTDYQHSGKEAVYETHKEVSLDLFQGWA